MPFKPGNKHGGANKGTGRGIAFLRAAIANPTDECLIWPLFRDPLNGYGRMGYLGKQHWAHRVACELAHGEPPTPEHEAAHLCGKGHDGCVNPRHLAWKTASENHLDRRRHGTAVTSTNGPRLKVPRETRDLIRRMRDRYTLAQLGALFDLPFQTISRIEKEDPNKKLRFRIFEPAEDLIVLERSALGVSAAAIGRELGRTAASIHRRRRRLRHANGVQ